MVGAILRQEASETPHPLGIERIGGEAWRPCTHRQHIRMTSERHRGCACGTARTSRDGRNDRRRLLLLRLLLAQSVPKLRFLLA